MESPTRHPVKVCQLETRGLILSLQHKGKLFKRVPSGSSARLRMFSNIYLGNFVLSATLDLGLKSCTVGINLTAAVAAAALRVIT